MLRPSMLQKSADSVSNKSKESMHNKVIVSEEEEVEVVNVIVFEVLITSALEQPRYV